MIAHEWFSLVPCASLPSVYTGRARGERRHICATLNSLPVGQDFNRAKFSPSTQEHIAALDEEISRDNFTLFSALNRWKESEVSGMIVIVTMTRLIFRANFTLNNKAFVSLCLSPPPAITMLCITLEIQTVIKDFYGCGMPSAGEENLYEDLLSLSQ